jgi:DNA polymerase III subunit delta
MKLKLEQLATQLKNTLSPIYLLSGDKTLLVQEAQDRIRAVARKQDFNERNVFTIDAKFNWQRFAGKNENLSLFSKKRLIELRFSKKPTKPAQAALKDYIKNINPDNLLLITLPKLDAATQKTKWFGTLEKASVHVQIWPVSVQQLPQWIARRAKKLGVTIAADAVEMIAQQTEGNLLASQQALEKLQLCYPNAPIETKAVADMLSTDARFTVFTLVDAVLAGQTKRYTRILQSLQTEAFEPVIVLWALIRETRQIIALKTRMKKGETLDQAMRSLFIWSSRKALLKQFVSRVKKAQLYRALSLARNADRAMKGLGFENAWQQLLLLCLTLNGTRV